MIYRLLADITVIIHLLFVAFVVAGGLLVFKWKRVIWLHIPAAIWGVLIEFFGWICPLTPLENWLRHQGGAAGYQSGFIEHYILPVLYPTALTPTLQIILGLFVIVVNLAVYGYIGYRYFKVKK